MCKPMLPILKWVGGKRQLLDEIVPRLPDQIPTYGEPFLGGGALLFNQRFERVVAGDLNADLITTYEVVRDDVEGLITALGCHENTSEHFYEVRGLDRDPEAYAQLSKLDRATRFLYLNRTCFNGMFRVNSRGEFNVPYGKYKGNVSIDVDNLRAVSTYLQSGSVALYTEDFESLLRRVPNGGFVYLDPPYDPVSETASFVGYGKGGFNMEEQRRLRRCCDILNKRDVAFMLSNAATPFVRDLYAGYRVEIVQARRSVGASGRSRAAVPEVLVRNY